MAWRQAHELLSVLIGYLDSLKRRDLKSLKGLWMHSATWILVTRIVGYRYLNGLPHRLSIDWLILLAVWGNRILRTRATPGKTPLLIHNLPDASALNLNWPPLNSILLHCILKRSTWSEVHFLESSLLFPLTALDQMVVCSRYYQGLLGFR